MEDRVQHGKAKKRKGKEMEVIKVKRSGKGNRVEMGRQIDRRRPWRPW